MAPYDQSKLKILTLFKYIYLKKFPILDTFIYYFGTGAEGLEDDTLITNLNECFKFLLLLFLIPFPHVLHLCAACPSK